MVPLLEKPRRSNLIFHPLPGTWRTDSSRSAATGAQAGESLARDAKLGRYVPRTEALTTLGLKSTTLVRVAAAGAMRYVEGPDQNFPAGFFFLREDVTAIVEGFERDAVPLKDY